MRWPAPVTPSACWTPPPSCSRRWQRSDREPSTGQWDSLLRSHPSGNATGPSQGAERPSQTDASPCLRRHHLHHHQTSKETLKSRTALLLWTDMSILGWYRWDRLTFSRGHICLTWICDLDKYNKPSKWAFFEKVQSPSFIILTSAEIRSLSTLFKMHDFKDMCFHDHLIATNILVLNWRKVEPKFLNSFNVILRLKL